ncbi:MAG: gamma-glutamylcyclotransferase [Pseudomonadota bacterium]|nr:gamma-glutamylcyclotransferase [Pseudomonadota bacterium]
MFADEGATLAISASQRGEDGGYARTQADFWVFAYGSLIWNPGFAYLARVPARLTGYHRRYCIRSVVYRGTPELPGLVLGLQPGGECEGVAYRVAGALKDGTMQYLRARELITDVYQEMLAAIETRDGERCDAYTYVADPAHGQFVADDDDEATIEVIARASGVAGANSEYALNTAANLAAIGVHDALIERVAAALRRRAA